MKNLSPIRHQHNPELWRVPLQKIEDKHTLYIGDNCCRTFDSQTLPDFISSKMAMINASQDLDRYPLDTLPTVYSLLNRFDKESNYELMEVGWKASAKWYCVCLREHEIDSLATSIGGYHGYGRTHNNGIG